MRITTTTRRKMAAQQEVSEASKRRKMAAQQEVSEASKRRKMAAQQEVSEASKRRKMTEEACSYLPDDLWECVFKSLNGDHLTFKSLSVVSKQFLYITNRLRSSLTITDQTIPFLPRIFQRFPNLRSLDLTRLSRVCDLDALLIQISTFNCDLRDLSCNSIAANGLRALSKTMKNLTSFSCSRMYNINKKDLFFIAECFPLLEELVLTNPYVSSYYDLMLDDNDPFLALPKLRKLDLSGNFIKDLESINYHLKNCHLLQEFIMVDCFFWRLMSIYQ
ncbi:uncharacterized protein LOC131606140 [Vicia villosa]|uniref:uncharacterized protein LOC131606140 n=1 Tax=Vicia villosa TaxID=3911 RepID=UPI00273AED92|nr:uncharacterized protein LOC131606140 [Vicia villosa]